MATDRERTPRADRGFAGLSNTLNAPTSVVHHRAEARKIRPRQSSGVGPAQVVDTAVEYFGS